MTDNDKTTDSVNNPPQQAQKATSTAVLDDGKKAGQDKGGDEGEKKPEKKGFWTWDRFIDLLKVLATVYAACIGTIVTMQFNERQHELAKIEAIAKLLPSLASSEVEYAQPRPKATDATTQNPPAAVPEVKSNRVVRDGTMWAIFRTAQNKTMLRDLAALMPEDVYRVVGSIAAADALDQDNDSLTALEVASEKLAAKYSADGNSALAGRLYDQALRLKKHEDGPSSEPLDIIDLTNLEHFDLSKYKDGDQQVVDMMQSAINLADAHVIEAKEDQKGGSVNTTHSDAKTFYMHAIEAGEAHKSSKAVQVELAKAYMGIGRVELLEVNIPNAIISTRKALVCYEAALGPQAHEVGDTCKTLAEQLLKENPRSTEAQQLLARSKNILSKAPR